MVVWEGMVLVTEVFFFSLFMELEVSVGSTHCGSVASL